ncbi:hypothetical protein [Robinsoniella sp. KNHs210]|uniref:hypothetical protein n=1 Tax=Robinsoniella sp. KNHs210 TaxID=1469950 RepID=UPI00126A3A96|nr:hypothetical protein [Robinsoniella sp. KNHs210]
MISAESDVRRHCFVSFQPALSVTASKACSLAHMAHSAYTEAASPAGAPAKNADWMNAHNARLRSPYVAQDKPFA